MTKQRRLRRLMVRKYMRYLKSKRLVKKLTRQCSGDFNYLLEPWSAEELCA